MTETLEQIKAKARALRNAKKPTNTAFVSTDPYNAKGSAKKGSQTNIKPARKPSV